MLIGTTDMTEEEKIMELEKIKRQQEKNRRDELMAKQRIISYRMARERNRQQKMIIKQQQQQQRLLSQSQSQSQMPSNYSYSSYDISSRQASIIGQSQPHVLSSSASSSSAAAGSLKRYDSMTLEPLHDEYSKLLMQQQQQQQQSSIENSEVARISLKDVSLFIHLSFHLFTFFIHLSICLPLFNSNACLHYLFYYIGNKY